MPDRPYADAFLGATWEDTGLMSWVDKNDDGVIQHTNGKVFAGKPAFELDERGEPVRGVHGQRMVTNVVDDGNRNELYVDRDIMVLANPEIAGLPDWVIALVAAGGLAAALSTAAGLLMVISSAVSHDLFKRMLVPDIGEKGELRLARIAAAVAVVFAGLLGIFPPDYVAAVVAFAFGLAASSFFPAILMGIFWKRMNAPGAVAGMVVGITVTTAYIVHFKFIDPAANVAENWFLGVSPEGFGTIGMLLNFAVAIPVCLLTARRVARSRPSWSRFSTRRWPGGARPLSRFPGATADQASSESVVDHLEAFEPEGGGDRAPTSVQRPGFSPPARRASGRSPAGVHLRARRARASRRPPPGGVETDREFQRRTGVVMPDLDRIDAVPSIDHAAGKEEVDRGPVAPPAVGAVGVSPGLGEPSTLGVRLERERLDQFGDLLIGCFLHATSRGKDSAWLIPG